MTIDIDQAIGNYGELVDYLTYCNYKYNREISPDITVEQWKKVYGEKTEAMEKQLLAEKGITILPDLTDPAWFEPEPPVKSLRPCPEDLIRQEQESK